MEEYLIHRDLYLDVILDFENFVQAGICETCQSAEGTLRCLTCAGDHSWCRGCLIQSHQWLPFHKIQFWNGKCFQDTNLIDQGFIWYLGHGGRQCPCSGIPQPWGGSHGSADAETTHSSTLVIVHSSGVFKHKIWWCQCPGLDCDWHIQLLKAGLFPASIMRPSTAFTFEVLDHFLIDALECKTSAMSFFQKIRRLTDNAFPDSIPVSDIRFLQLRHFSKY